MTVDFLVHHATPDKQHDNALHLSFLLSPNSVVVAAVVLIGAVVPLVVFVLVNVVAVVVAVGTWSVSGDRPF